MGALTAMRPHLKTTSALLMATSLLGGKSLAANISVNLTLPQIDTAEYHRPYVAVWLESADRKTIRDVAVWFDMRKPNDEGKKWLKDLRQWWRLSGRYHDGPTNGVTGATRPVGTHTLHIDTQSPELANLPAGQYELVVEAAREKGGRELVRLPLPWPVKPGDAQKQQGKTELGAIEWRAQP